MCNTPYVHRLEGILARDFGQSVPPSMVGRCCLWPVENNDVLYPPYGKPATAGIQYAIAALDILAGWI
jgi:hypothetical protein